MDGVDARYLGLTANQLAKIATDLKAENDRLRNILAHAVMLVDLYEGLTNTRLSLDGGIVDCDCLRAWCKKLGIEVPS